MDKILLVEDDYSLAIGMVYIFGEEGFECVHAQTAEAAKRLYDSSYDLIIMDVSLPDGNGYDLCREIRQQSDTPLIFLTSYDDEVNIVMGLDIGGDDYITKPFQLKVLISRIKANLRRRTTYENVLLKAGDIQVDVEGHRALVAGIKLDLTSTELRLLTLLISNINKTLTRHLILEKIWDHRGKYIDDNTVSVHIRHIREKLRYQNASASIVTVRGIGYRMEI